jgi:hypothetical protein
MQAVVRRLGTVLASLLSATGFLFGLLGNVISALIPTAYVWWAVFIIGAFAVVLWFVARWAVAQWASDWEITFETPKTLNDAGEQERNARPGLIGYVSKFAPYQSELSLLKGKEQADAIATAMANEDYKTLDFKNSNLEPLIHAIVGHKSALKHCWLIATSGPGGSEAVLPALKRYLVEVEGMTCEFHDDTKYRISQTDDAVVYNQSYDIVRLIYTNAAKDYEMKAPDIVVDATGGTKSMTLGATLASLGKQHDVELVGSKYGPDGRPERGTLFTLLFRFAPNPPRFGG